MLDLRNKKLLSNPCRAPAAPNSAGSAAEAGLLGRLRRAAERAERHGLDADATWQGALGSEEASRHIHSGTSESAALASLESSRGAALRERAGHSPTDAHHQCTRQKRLRLLPACPGCLRL